MEPQGEAPVPQLVLEAAGGGIPIRMSGSTVGLDRPAPKLGSDNAAILGGLLGLDEEEIARLKADGII